MIGIKEGAEELLEDDDTWLIEERGAEGNPFELPDDAFIFLMHQGYQFMYFHTADRNEDPPVYYYLEWAAYFYHLRRGEKEDTGNPYRLAERLSEFLTVFIRCLILF